MLKRRSIILIVLMILAFLIVPSFTSFVSAASTTYVDVFGNSMAYVHAQNSSLRPIYCIYHGKPLTYAETISGKKVKWAEYLSDDKNNVKLEPSIGYAFAYANTVYGSGWSDDEGHRKAMQQIVWASHQWGSVTSGYEDILINGKGVTTDKKGNSVDPSKPSNQVYNNPMVARSYQYGKVWYQILKDADDTLFKITPGEDKGTITGDELKIIVDKSTGQYIVGPYTIECTKGDAESKEILYNEIMSGDGISENDGYTDSTKFAAYSELIGINYKTGTQPEILQPNGERFGGDGSPVSFPDFSSSNNKFYIKFTPSSEYINQIAEGLPEIKIEYLKDFIGDVTKRKSTKLIMGKEKGSEGYYTKSELPGDMAIQKGGSYIVDVEADGETYKATMKVNSITLPSSVHSSSSKVKVHGKAQVDFILEFGGFHGAGHDDLDSFEGNPSSSKTITISKEIDIYQWVNLSWNASANRYEGHPNPNGTCYIVPGQIIDLGRIEINGVDLQELATVKFPGGINSEINYVPGSSGREWRKLKSKITYNAKGSCDIGEITTKLANKSINLQLGGNVWLDVDQTKGPDSNRKVDGRRNNIKGGYEGFLNNDGNLYEGDINFGGVQVELYRADGTYVASTTTNENGVYRFYGLIAGVSDGKTGEALLSPFQNYFVRFRFNGQLYQQTTYTEDCRVAPWPSGDEIGSSAIEEGRIDFNKRFETIESTISQKGDETSSHNNYDSYEGGWNKSYSIYHKIENSSGDYISYSGKYVDGALTYGDIWDLFVKEATNTTSTSDSKTRDAEDYNKVWADEEGTTWSILYNATGHGQSGGSPYKSSLDSKDKALEYLLSSDSYEIAFNEIGKFLSDKGVSADEVSWIKNFIRDCMLTSTTRTTFVTPDIGQLFIINDITESKVSAAGEKDSALASTHWADAKNLYTKASDQSRYIDYGVTLRETNDISIQKDVFKVTTIVDGEKEVYDYTSKDVTRDSEGWKIGIRKFDQYVNSGDKPSTEDGRSYDSFTAGNRFDGSFVHPLEVRRSDYEEDFKDNRNLQVFITYRIAIINEGSYRVKINELADYYEVDDLEFDGTLNEDGTSYKNQGYYEYNMTDGSKGPEYVNSYIGSDENGTKLEVAGDDKDLGGRKGDLKVTNKGRDSRDNRHINKEDYYNYDTIYITGATDGVIKNIDGDNYLAAAQDAQDRGGVLSTNQAFVYVTFKVKNAGSTNLEIGDIEGKVRLDESLLSGQLKLGKRNIAEINSYSTYYTDSNTNYNEVIGTINYQPAGLIDLDSNPGSLKNKDLVPNKDPVTDEEKEEAKRKGGSIRTGLDKKTGDFSNTVDRQQDDTDAAPPIRLILNDGGDETRVFSGIAFEDSRTEKDDASKVVIGDGRNANTETKIDGITMELWRLNREVDEQGIFTGTYSGSPTKMERYIYSVRDGEKMTGSTEYYRYKTGTGAMKTIVDAYAYDSAGNKITNGPLSVPEDKIPYDDTTILSNYLKNDPKGKYAFVSLPAGDYFIRFKYGDTTDTVLMQNGDNEIGNNRVNDLLNESLKNGTEHAATGEGKEYANDIIYGNSGKNYKSYNGQDYKSTIYQKDISQAGDSYYNIARYTDIDNQNYSTELTTTNSGNDRDAVLSNINDTKAVSYYYDITKSESKNNSDAKDVYYYRNRADKYGRGELTGTSTQRNTLAETLCSFEKLATYTELDSTLEGMTKKGSTRQWSMIKELINNTNMVAQTGVISTKGEKDTLSTDFSDKLVNNSDGNTQTSKYLLKNIDLGLQERPEAQLKLTKKISNFSLILANGQTLFNTDKTVRNLYLADHAGHKTFFTTTESEDAFKNIKNDLKEATKSLNDGTSGSKLRNYTDNLKDTSTSTRRLAAVVTSANSTATPELLQLYMDDELMEGAQVGVRYSLVVENVGEVDYAEKNFYYTGKVANANTLVKTNAEEVVDYVSNLIRYDQAYQTDTWEGSGTQATWTAKTLTELINSVAQEDESGAITYKEIAGTIQVPNSLSETGYEPIEYKNLVERKDDSLDKIRSDYVNRAYADIAKTYNTIIMTKDLSGDLSPIKYNDGKGSKETSLILATQISSNNTGDNLVYNNLAEIVETTNTVGRRMKYSIVGNQRMGDQSQGNDASPGVSSEDLITPGRLARDEVSPTEIDADSAQKIVITKPTGENRNYDIIIIASIAALMLIGAGALFVRRAFKM